MSDICVECASNKLGASNTDNIIFRSGFCSCCNKNKGVADVSKYPVIDSVYIRQRIATGITVIVIICIGFISLFA